MKKWAQKDVVLWLSPHAIHIIKKNMTGCIGAGLSWEIRMRKFIMPVDGRKRYDSGCSATCPGDI